MGAPSLTGTFYFVPNESWSGTPPNTQPGEQSVYLKVTVSRTAASTIGTGNNTTHWKNNGEPPYLIGKR